MAKESNLDSFDINSVRIMTYMLAKDGVVDDEILDILSKLKFDYYQLLEKNRILESKIDIDDKTGLLKYREDFLENVVKIASRALENNRKGKFSISYTRIDIDDFSIFNNKYGHDIGDEVLKKISKIMKDTTRPTDFCIRFGGEEFDILLPYTSIKGVQSLLDKLMAKIKRIRIRHQNTNLKVTISAGISSISFDNSFIIGKVSKSVLNKKYKELQKQADDALYDAKLSGKNRYCLYDLKKKTEYKKIRTAYSKKSS